MSNREIYCDSCSEVSHECPESWSVERALQFFADLAAYEEMPLACWGCDGEGEVSVSEDGEAAELVFRVK